MSHLLETIAINLGCGFLSSMGALALWFHFDLDGWWEQKRIERGRRMDEKTLKKRLDERKV